MAGTEIGTRDWGIVVIGLLFVEIGTTLGLWVRKGVGHFKWDLMGHPTRSMEDSGSEGDLNCGESRNFRGKEYVA